MNYNDSLCLSVCVCVCSLQAVQNKKDMEDLKSKSISFSVRTSPAPDAALNKGFNSINSMATPSRTSSPILVWILMSFHSAFTVISSSKLAKELTIPLICRGRWAWEEEGKEKIPKILLQEESFPLPSCAWEQWQVSYQIRILHIKYILSP